MQPYMITAVHQSSLSHDLYILSCEREKQIQNVIAAVKNYPYETMPQAVFIEVLQQNNIKPSSLSSAELRRIQNAIEG